ncbi:MAG: hypothetical protein P4L22_07900 [Candidatus Babeliales bacterium]|nr:hypothetical protein [Candidatus Babeliales bacterium]
MQHKFFKVMLLLMVSNYTNMNASSALTINFPKNGSIIPDNKPKITGTAIAVNGGGSISVSLDGKFLGFATEIFCPPPQPCINWNITPNKPLKEGVHTVVATAQLDGNFLTAKSTFTIKKFKLAILSPANDSTIAGSVVVRGTAQPGSALAIQIINVQTGKSTLGKLKVDDTGIWSFRPARVILGRNVIRVTATSATGAITTVSSSFILVAPAGPSSNSSCCR